MKRRWHCSPSSRSAKKSEIDDIISKFQDYEATLGTRAQMQLVGEAKETAQIVVFAIATSSRIDGIIKKYEQAQLASRQFYDRLLSEKRLLIWDGESLLRDARQVLTRRYELPMEVELTATSDWSTSGAVRLGIVKGRDLADLEELHGPGLFFENVRGWKGLEPTKNDETVNESIRNTIVEEPAEMLARNDGVVFRATRIDQDGRRLVLHEASIVNGRQTTGCLTAVHADILDSCEIPIKVVEAEGDAWPIAAAANNQNSVARIDLRLARYFREQLVQREMASAAGGDEWMTEVMQPLKAREDRFDHLRYLFIGLFCRRPNQLAEDNYSNIRWDVLTAMFEGGEPPPNLYPTLFAIVRATDDALQLVEGLGDADPLAKIHDDHRPKYRAYLGILTLCGTQRIDLSEQLGTLDAEVDRLQTWVMRAAELLDGVGQQVFAGNFMNAYEIAGVHAIDAYEDSEGIRIQQRLSNSLFHSGFSKLYRQLLLKIQLDERKQATRLQP